MLSNHPMNNVRRPDYAMWGRIFPEDSPPPEKVLAAHDPTQPLQLKMWGREEPPREPFSCQDPVGEAVRQVIAELLGIRKGLDSVVTYGNLQRIVPFVYGQERIDSAGLMALLLDHPEQFKPEGLRQLREASYQKLASLPALRRSFECTAETRATNNSREVGFRASTFAKDRHGSRVRPDGIDTANFERNPIFLWGHDGYGGWTPPQMEHVIGRVVRLRKSSAALDVDVEFLTGDVNPRAEQALRMVRAKALNSVSIGFIPREVVTNIEDGREVPTIVKSELLEISLVAIPSNPEAVVTSRAR